MSERLTARGHHHAEAFCLMWYACKCGHQERIWNSRDGVTPFCALCPSCGSPDEMGTLQHVRWRDDLYAPEHEPTHGQRIWIDMTREAAEAYVDRRIAVVKASGVPGDIGNARREALIKDVLGEERGSVAPDLKIAGYDWSAA